MCFDLDQTCLTCLCSIRESWALTDMCGLDPLSYTLASSLCQSSSGQHKEPHTELISTSQALPSLITHILKPLDQSILPPMQIAAARSGLLSPQTCLSSRVFVLKKYRPARGHDSFGVWAPVHLGGKRAVSKYCRGTRVDSPGTHACTCTQVCTARTRSHFVSSGSSLTAFLKS